jgi:hypothetical protein
MKYKSSQQETTAWQRQINFRMCFWVSSKLHEKNFKKPQEYKNESENLNKSHQESTLDASN